MAAPSATATVPNATEHAAITDDGKSMRAAAIVQRAPRANGDYDFCTVCHGVYLQGNVAIGAPRLTGLPAWYLTRQLERFREGARGYHELDLNGRDMRVMADALHNDTDIAGSVAFVAEQPVATVASDATMTRGDTTAGGRLYQPCAACHGAGATDNEDYGAPNLAIQSPWYLAAQLRNYRDGLRGTHSSDTFGNQMRPMTLSLSDTDIDNLVAYIKSLDASPAD